MKVKFCWLGCCLLLTTSAVAQTTLLSWDVNAASASLSPILAGTPTTGISSGSLSLGAGVSASSAASTFGGSGFNQTTFADAIAANDYISFTLTPTSGYSVSLTSIELYLGKSSSTSVSFTAYLTSSLTGFTASSALDTYTFTNQSAPLRSITLSSSNFSNLTSTVEFRLYGATGTTTDTFRIRNFNDVSDLRINGSATPSAVPEPSTYAAVAGLSALLFAAMRRRRR